MSNLIESIITSIQSNIVFALVALSVLVIVYTVSLAIIFKKIGHKALIAFIPIYNIMSLLSILNIPQWMVLSLFVPFVNVVGIPFLTIIIGYKLGTLCRKNGLMKIGLMFLAPIFYPLLAFTDIDVDGSKLKYVIEPVKKVEFKLDPVEVITDIEVPEAMNLANAETLDKITVKKIKPVVEKKESNVSTESIAEHLEKANKERPTAQDLTFDYNLIYNSNETKKDKVEEVVEQKVEVTPIVIPESKIEEKNEEVEVEEDDDTPVIPVLHDIVLEEANLNDISDVPVPINQRYENQMNANRKQAEKKRELEQNQEKKKEEIVQVIEPAIILDNGPVNVSSSIAGIMAAAPDFNVSQNKTTKEEPNEIKTEMPINNTPTTEVQEIVSMNIVEPSQLPVGINSNAEEKKKMDESKKEENKAVDNQQQTTEQTSSSLLRPVVSPTSAHVQVDKVCPQCNVKLKRDCPVCIICGYKFPG